MVFQGAFQCGLVYDFVSIFKIRGLLIFTSVKIKVKKVSQGFNYTCGLIIHIRMPFLNSHSPHVCDQSSNCGESREKTLGNTIIPSYLRILLLCPVAGIELPSFVTQHHFLPPDTGPLARDTEASWLFHSLFILLSAG